MLVETEQAAGCKPAGAGLSRAQDRNGVGVQTGVLSILPPPAMAGMSRAWAAQGCPPHRPEVSVVSTHSRSTTRSGSPHTSDTPTPHRSPRFPGRIRPGSTGAGTWFPQRHQESPCPPSSRKGDCFYQLLARSAQLQVPCCPHECLICILSCNKLPASLIALGSEVKAPVQLKWQVLEEEDNYSSFHHETLR